MPISEREIRQKMASYVLDEIIREVVLNLNLGIEIENLIKHEEYYLELENDTADTILLFQFGLSETCSIRLVYIAEKVADFIVEKYHEHGMISIADSNI